MQSGMSGEPVAPSVDNELAEEDRLRAQVYQLLASVLSQPPSSEYLTSVSKLQGVDTPLGRAVSALARVAAKRDAAAASEEYHNLFIGVGRGELLPFASYYLTGFLHEKPLARLRDDMAKLGIVRRDTASEPEDHVASILEVMAGLIDGRFGSPATLDQQQEFYEAHVSSWMDIFFRDLAEASSSVLYAAVGGVGTQFLKVETAAFQMD
ncbi:MAG: TorD/DmsD family molecular chaperone [Hyphomicrobiaceae bacterium]